MEHGLRGIASPVLPAHNCHPLDGLPKEKIAAYFIELIDPVQLDPEPEYPLMPLCTISVSELIDFIFKSLVFMKKIVINY